MNQSTLFLTLNQKWDDAIQWADQRLAEAGMRTMLTFDFQTARSAQAECTCPHHGTESCDCQMVILLVYDGTQIPVSLLIHGNNDHTYFYLADSPIQRGDPELEVAVRRVLDGNPLDWENSVEIPLNRRDTENDSEEIVNERRQVFSDRKNRFVDWLNKHGLRAV